MECAPNSVYISDDAGIGRCSPCFESQYSFDSISCVACPTLALDGIEKVGGCASLNGTTTDLTILPGFWPEVGHSFQTNGDLLPCEYPASCAASLCEQICSLENKQCSLNCTPSCLYPYDPLSRKCSKCVPGYRISGVKGQGCISCSSTKGWQMGLWIVLLMCSLLSTIFGLHQLIPFFFITSLMLLFILRDGDWEFFVITILFWNSLHLQSEKHNALNDGAIVSFIFYIQSMYTFLPAIPLPTFFSNSLDSFFSASVLSLYDIDCRSLLGIHSAFNSLYFVIVIVYLLPLATTASYFLNKRLSTLRARFLHTEELFGDIGSSASNSTSIKTQKTFASSALFFSCLLFVNLGTEIIRTWGCQRDSSSSIHHYLVSLPYVPCSGTEWITALVLGLILGGGAFLGIAYCYYDLLFRNRSAMRFDREVIGFIISPFREEYFWWGVGTELKILLLSFIVQLFPSRLLLVVFLLISSLLAHLFIRPFRDPTHNVLELISQGVVLFCYLFNANPSVGYWYGWFISLTTLLCIAFYMYILCLPSLKSIPETLMRVSHSLQSVNNSVTLEAPPTTPLDNVAIQEYDSGFRPFKNEEDNDGDGDDDGRGVLFEVEVKKEEELF